MALKKEKVVWKKEQALTGRFYRVERNHYDRSVRVSSFQGTLVGDTVYVFAKNTTAVRKVPASLAFKTPKAALESLKSSNGFNVESNEYYTKKMPTITKCKVLRQADGDLQALDEQGRGLNGKAFRTREEAVKWLLKNQDAKIKECRARFVKKSKEYGAEIRHLLAKRRRTATLAKAR